MTSCDDADPGEGSVVNEVQYAYDSWGNLIEEWQSHDGAVDTQNTPAVQYTYQDGASGSTAKYVRLAEVIYPNGRAVGYDYGTAGAVDAIMSRLSSIFDDANSNGTLDTGETVDAAYKYLGAGQIVEEDYQQASVKLSYLDSNGDVTRLDRFGRVTDQLWTDYGQTPNVALDEYLYTYDRAGNRTARDNALNNALDESYTYDGLDRLTEWDINGSQQKTWTLDALGNNLAAGTYNAANEETPTAGSSGYDAAGNMTTLQSGDTAVYDAWNRMTEVNDGETIIQRNEYDGANRRIQIFS